MKNRYTLTTALLLAFQMPALAQTSYAQISSDDEIIVTGSPFIRSVDEAITGLSVLTGDELDERLAATIGETLKTEPGVSSTFFGAGASRPIIRGQGGDRVRVLVNGIGSIDASSASPDHAVAAEPAQAERIEVVRGASLLRYGSSGAGGIVNVIDGRVPMEAPDGIDGVVRIGASSVDDGIEAAGALDFAVPAGEGQFVLHLDGTYKDADDYTIPVSGESRAQLEEEGEEIPDDFDDNRELENSAVEAQSFTAGIGYVGDRVKFGIAINTFDTDYGLPGGHGHGHEEEEHEEGEDHDEDEDHDEEEEEEENVTIDLDQTRIDVNGSIEMDGFIERLQLFGGYADYKHTEFEAPGEPGTVFANEGYEVRLEAIQQENNGWKAAHGLHIRNRDFSAIGEEAFVPPTDTQQIALYTFHEKDLGDYHLEGALRYENTKQENSLSGADRSFDLFSLSVGGDMHLSDNLRIGGTVFRTERAPTTEELFANGPHLATAQFEVGDPTLGKETAIGLEAALRYRKDDVFFTANLFHTDYDGYIFEVGTGEEEDELDVFQFTADDATFSGFEIQGGFGLGAIGSFNLSADGLLEYVRAKTDTGNLPRIPPVSVLTGLELDNDTFNFRAELDLAGKQSKVGENELATDDYTQVNLFASMDLPIAGDVKLNASVMNLFDTEARQHTSFIKDLVPLPGRNFRLSLTSRF